MKRFTSKINAKLFTFLFLVIGITVSWSSDWKFYYDDKYKFSIQVNSNWFIEQSNNMIIFSPDSKTEKKVMIYSTSGSLLQKEFTLWDFASSYGFQNIEGCEEFPNNIQEIHTQYGIEGIKVKYWIKLIDGRRIVSNEFIFFNTDPISDFRLVFENAGVESNTFQEIARTFRYVLK